MARPILYERGSDEFSRVVAFTDGVFAIAMTLLVVQIEIPKVSGADLAEAVGDQSSLILSFFISFVVIGYYWLAHHRFFSQLQRVDPVLMLINLMYLSVIAFLPFPTGLVGNFEGEPLSVVIYAASLGAASLFEVLMFARARHAGALRRPISDKENGYALVASLSPVVIFALSIPIAFYSTTLALLFWLVNFPVERFLTARFRPPSFLADESSDGTPGESS
jgi:uncharacterized membrane protein